MKEMTGSGIFVGNEGDEELESGSANPSQNKTGIRMYQVSIEQDHIGVLTVNCELVCGLDSKAIPF